MITIQLECQENVESDQEFTRKRLQGSTWSYLQITDKHRHIQKKHLSRGNLLVLLGSE